jgi:HPt (histidine-containing phosphotransfer) domain-containing protein
MTQSLEGEAEFDVTRPTEPQPEAAPPPTAAVLPAPALAADTPPVFHPAGLQRLQALLGQEAAALLPGLFDTFYQEANKLLGQVRRSWERGQAADLHRAAHALKGNAAHFGALALAEVARELEHLARDGRLEEAGALVERAEAEFAAARIALEEARKEG